MQPSVKPFQGGMTECPSSSVSGAASRDASSQGTGMDDERTFRRPTWERRMYISERKAAALASSPSTSRARRYAGRPHHPPACAPRPSHCSAPPPWRRPRRCRRKTSPLSSWVCSAGSRNCFSTAMGTSRSIVRLACGSMSSPLQIVNFSDMHFGERWGGWSPADIHGMLTWNRERLVRLMGPSERILLDGGTND